MRDIQSTESRQGSSVSWWRDELTDLIQWLDPNSQCSDLALDQTTGDSICETKHFINNWPILKRCYMQLQYFQLFYISFLFLVRICALEIQFIKSKVFSNWQALVFTVTLKNLLTLLLTDINMFKLRVIKNSSRYTLY